MLTVRVKRDSVNDYVGRQQQIPNCILDTQHVSTFVCTWCSFWQLPHFWSDFSEILKQTLSWMSVSTIKRANIIARESRFRFMIPRWTIHTLMGRDEWVRRQRRRSNTVRAAQYADHCIHCLRLGRSLPSLRFPVSSESQHTSFCLVEFSSPSCTLDERMLNFNLISSIHFPAQMPVTYCHNKHSPELRRRLSHKNSDKTFYATLLTTLQN